MHDTTDLAQPAHFHFGLHHSAAGGRTNLEIESDQRRCSSHRKPSMATAPRPHHHQLQQHLRPQAEEEEGKAVGGVADVAAVEAAEEGEVAAMALRAMEVTIMRPIKLQISMVHNLQQERVALMEKLQPIRGIDVVRDEEVEVEDGVAMALWTAVTLPLPS